MIIKDIVTIGKKVWLVLDDKFKGLLSKPNSTSQSEPTQSSNKSLSKEEKIESIDDDLSTVLKVKTKKINLLSFKYFF